MDFEKDFIQVKGRPIPKEPLQFFQYKANTRIFVSITDDPKVWQEDLIICERFFADMIICPVGSEDDHSSALTVTQDILKQRMKYPGVKENPLYETIAKTWVLPNKLLMGPSATEFLSPLEDAASRALTPLFEKLKVEPLVHLLKLETGRGFERKLLYSFLDSGFRPSLIMVKWSHDADDHIPTAYCAGHLLNSGYSLVQDVNGYSLYFFRDQPLYDICSLKTVALENPMMTELMTSVLENLRKSDAPSEQPTEKPTE
jgi:hypothetical protein